MLIFAFSISRTQHFDFGNSTFRFGWKILFLCIKTNFDRFLLTQNNAVKVVEFKKNTIKNAMFKCPFSLRSSRFTTEPATAEVMELLHYFTMFSVDINVVIHTHFFSACHLVIGIICFKIAWSEFIWKPRNWIEHVFFTQSRNNKNEAFLVAKLKIGKRFNHRFVAVVIVGVVVGESRCQWRWQQNNN